MCADVVKTYVKGLDERIDAGIPAGSIVLICGTPGSLKTTFCYNILLNHAMQSKERGLYISLEQHRDSIISQMKRIGFDGGGAKDIVTVVDLAHLRKFLGQDEAPTSVDWLKILSSQIKFFRDEGYRVIAIDSLDALYVLSPMENVRSRLFFFFEELRELGVSLMFISEMEPGGRAFGKHGVEGFLCDGIIHLEIERIGKTVGRFISIVKMRGASHPTDYFPMIVDKGEFRIVQR